MVEIIVALVLFTCFMYLFLKNDSQTEKIENLTVANDDNLKIITWIIQDKNSLLLKLQKYQHRNDDLIKENTEIVRENKEMYLEIKNLNKINEELNEKIKLKLKYLWLYKRKNTIKRLVIQELIKTNKVSKTLVKKMTNEIHNELKNK